MPSLNLTLKPAQIELIARPGSTIIQAYNVTNNTDASLFLSTSVAPWLPQGTDGSVSYQNIPSNPDFEFSLANSDLKLDQTFILRAGETRQLVLKIKSHPNAKLTDAYFTFFIIQDQSSTLNPDSNISSATGRLGSHILLSTSSIQNPASQAAISRFTSQPLFKDIFLTPISLKGQVDNLSDYFFKSTGTLTITKNNRIIKTFDLFPQNVLAKSSRNLLCNSNNEPAPCVLNPPLWPGFYTATISLDPSLQAPPVTTSFFVFPYILSSSLLFCLFLYLFFKKTKKSVKTKQ